VVNEASTVHRRILKILLLVEMSTRRERRTLVAATAARWVGAMRLIIMSRMLPLPCHTPPSYQVPSQNSPSLPCAPRLPSVYDRQEPGSSLCFLPLRPSGFKYFHSQLPRHLTMLLHFPAIDPMARCIPGRYIDDHVGTCIAPLRAKYTINHV
jgi:hypothetical protein